MTINMSMGNVQQITINRLTALLSTLVREYKVGAQNVTPRENMMKSNLSYVEKIKV
jgi:hypothetical protein